MQRLGIVENVPLDMAVAVRPQFSPLKRKEQPADRLERLRRTLLVFGLLPRRVLAEPHFGVQLARDLSRLHQRDSAGRAERHAALLLAERILEHPIARTAFPQGIAARSRHR
jgi:hypothetical protein